MKHALVVLAVCFCAGIAAQAWLRIPLWATYGLFIASIAGCRAAMSGRHAFAGCSLAAVALSGAVLLSVHDILPADHIAKARCYLHSAMCVIQGVIVQEPRKRGSRTVLMLRAQEIRTAHLIRKCSGSVQVYLTGETQVGYGDLVQVCGRLGRPVFAIAGSPGFADSCRHASGDDPGRKTGGSGGALPADDQNRHGAYPGGERF